MGCPGRAPPWLSNNRSESISEESPSSGSWSVISSADKSSAAPPQGTWHDIDDKPAPAKTNFSDMVKNASSTSNNSRPSSTPPGDRSDARRLSERPTRDTTSAAVQCEDLG
eukprot:2565323-Pyramimonas_sp.AAC.1